jgi:hypothetical protein
VEDDLLGGSHLSAVNEKEKKRKREEGVCGLARRLLGWSFPGRPSSSPFSFFLCCFFSYFLFSISFITFAIVTQMTSNQLQKFSKNKVNILKQ